MSINQIKNLLIDMDGVLWRADEPMPGLTDFFETMRARQMGFMLITNNAMTTIEGYTAKLGHFGIEVEADQVLTSSYATAGWLTEQLPPGARVYAVGEEGVHTALAEAGFTIVSGEAPDGAEAVVVALYLGIDYLTIHHAARLAREGALFVGTNPDPTYPIPGGQGVGSGTIIAAVATAAGKEPVIIGKPNTLMFEQALKRLGARPEETAMIGDRLETDILGGQKAGLKTILVLSGVTSAEDLADSEIQPTWVFDDIAALTAALT